MCLLSTFTIAHSKNVSCARWICSMINLLPTELFKSKKLSQEFWQISTWRYLPSFLEYLDISNTSGLYYKPLIIINYDSMVINKLETSLTDDARVVMCDCHMFIVQATDHKILSICWHFATCDNTKGALHYVKTEIFKW